ncbi:MAG: hypothetical protein U0792_06920 [Gemmataceae bacterium]
MRRDKVQRVARNDPRTITHKAWLESESPGELIRHLNATQQADGTRRGRRKLMLFELACCRRGWELLEGDPVREAVEAIQQYVEGESSRRAAKRVVDRVRAGFDGQLPDEVVVDEDFVGLSLGRKGDPAPIDNLRLFALSMSGLFDSNFDTHYITAAHGVGGDHATEEFAAQCDLLRDIFGDPFRPIEFSSEWRTETAVLIARGMYQSHDFSAMPILADALQEADCNNDEILSHCRDANATHVRGCWVIDGVLGK